MHKQRVPARWVFGSRQEVDRMHLSGKFQVLLKLKFLISGALGRPKLREAGMLEENWSWYFSFFLNF